MKKLFLALFLGILAIIPVHAQQTVIVHRPGIFSDLANVTGAIVALPLAIVEGIVVGTTEAAGSLLHGSAQIVVPAPTIIVPAPPMVVSPPVVVAPSSAVIPTTTIVTTHSDGTVTTVTRQTSSYELGPVTLTPVAPTHRVGSSPHVNPYIFRPQ